MRTILSFAFLCICSGAAAQSLTGLVTDDKGQPLAFSTILVKGTTRGLSTDELGRFALRLPQGTVVLVCEHVGYAKVEKTIRIAGNDSVRFVLHPQDLHLGDIIIQAREDPAYGIIRHAIKTREAHLRELGSFRCQVYTKGVIRIDGYPKTFLGAKIDSGDSGIGENGILYLSETLANYASAPPDKEKLEVLSSRVSGDSAAYGLSLPYFVTFYKNIVPMGGLNPRGFISPIADGALHYYKYKLAGIFYEDGLRVDRIKVIPRRSFEPCFAGYINIVHDQWRIHSTDLYLLRSSQMQLLDTLTIQQVYAPAGDTGVWAIRSQVVIPYIRIFGFSGGGSFVTVYSKYDLHPVFPKGFFDNVVMKYDTGSNARPGSYWDTLRPVPLSAGEAEDYAEKDSIERAHNTPHYRDSVARAQRNYFQAILAGITNPTDVERKFGKYTLSYSPLLSGLSFNTVEGYEDEERVGLKKQVSQTRTYALFAQARYGLAAGLFSARGGAAYTFSTRTASTFSFSGGRYVYQFDHSDPVSNWLNAFYTLVDRENFMKLYVASFGTLKYTRDIVPGLKVSLTADFEDRTALENRDTSVWTKKDLPYFSPNYPTEIMDSAMPANRAASLTLRVTYHPGTRYVEFPGQTIPVRSTAPTFEFTYTKGLPSVFGSVSDYDKWTFSAKGDVDAHIAGRLSFYGSIGGFLSHRRVDVPDYFHFNGNETFVLSPGVDKFQAAPYYLLSNDDPFFAEAALEHHFNGLLTNKIPLFRRLNWFLVGGAKGLYLSDGRTYAEVSVGLENILKFLRFDYFWGFPSGFPAPGASNPLSPVPGSVFTGLRLSAGLGKAVGD